MENAAGARWLMCPCEIDKVNEPGKHKLQPNLAIFLSDLRAQGPSQKGNSEKKNYLLFLVNEA